MDLPQKALWPGKNHKEKQGGGDSFAIAMKSQPNENQERGHILPGNAKDTKSERTLNFKEPCLRTTGVDFQGVLLSHGTIAGNFSCHK